MPMSKSTPKSAPLDLPQPLKTFLSATALLAAASWLFVLLGRLLHLQIPYFWAYPIRDLGGDFRDYRHLFDHLHSMEFFLGKGTSGIPYLYPAPLAIFYHLLFALWGNRAHNLLVLWAFIGLSVCAATIILYLAMRRRGISSQQAAAFCILTGILSYPLQYEFFRGNVEIFIWVVLIAAMCAYKTDRLWLAGILLGIAIACKMYPIVLLGFCLRRKKFKVLPIALITCVLVDILSDIWLGPTFKAAAIETRHGTQMFLNLYAKGYIGLEYDHSFFAFFKTAAHHFRPNLDIALGCYMALVGTGCAVLYFVCIRKLPVVNQIVILFILSITLPPVSFDYTLLHLYTCWAIFTLYVLNRYVDGENVPMAGWAMFWFAFAMAPHSYAILFGHQLGAQVRLLGLVALLYLFLKHPFLDPNETSRTNRSNQIAEAIPR
jgi:hypothetical protein